MVPIPNAPAPGNTGNTGSRGAAAFGVGVLGAGALGAASIDFGGGGGDPGVVVPGVATGGYFGRATYGGGSFGHHRQHYYSSYWSLCYPRSFWLWRTCYRYYWSCYDSYYWPSERYDCARGYGGAYSARPAYTTLYSSWYTPEAYPAQPCAASLEEAWQLLADGLSGDAYDAFDCLVEQTPQDGLTLVGMGLTAAALGHDDEATTLVRAAVRNDPAALLYVPPGDQLDHVIDQLANRFDSRARTGYADFDALFMVGTLRFLLNDDAAAHYATEVATSLGDTDASLTNLRILIEKAQGSH